MTDTLENTLKEINAVIGVVGSFICLSDGTIAAQAMPDSIGAAELELASRIASQTFQALEISGQRANEAELVYDNNRLIMRNLRGGILAILCARTTSIPLLSFTANLAVKKLTGELKLSRPSASRTAQKAATVSVPREPASALGRKVAASALARELDQEVHRLEEIARANSVTLRVLDSLAIWLCCPNTRTLLEMPDKKQIEFAAPLAQRDSIMRLFEQAGYRSAESLDALAAGHRLHWVDAHRKSNIEIFLGVLELDHRLDLTLLLSQPGGIFSQTALLLTRLQTRELNDAALREICALLLEQDFSMESQPDKISASQIVEYCLNDEDLAQTILKNLGSLASFAAGALAASDQSIIVGRAQKLSKSINTGRMLVLSHSSSSRRAH